MEPPVSPAAPTKSTLVLDMMAVGVWCGEQGEKKEWWAGGQVKREEAEKGEEGGRRVKRTGFRSWRRYKLPPKDGLAIPTLSSGRWWVEGDVQFPSF